MRNLATYILAALVFGFALDAVAPAISIGSPSNRWPSVTMLAPAALQTVNRSAKSDRFNVSGKTNVDKAVGDGVPAQKPVLRSVPDGCDPAFSPLSASARLNYASRCIADNSSGDRSAV